MYKQKSWNVENMHMGVIKAFIVVSMLFVCMFSMKISARASENIYVTSNAGTHTHVWKDVSDNFVMTETFTLSDDTYYYFWSKTSSSAYYLRRYNLLDDSLSHVGTITVNHHQVYNDGKVSDYSNEVTKHWRNDFCFESKFVSSTLPVFDSDNSAKNFILTGDTSGYINAPEPVRIPTFVNDKYIETYSLKGFECDLTVSAKWTGHTRYIPPTLKPQKAIEKIIVEGIYFNEDEPCIFDILDINTTSWSRDIEKIRVDRLGNTLQYIIFTPYFYFEDEETIYYGNRISVDVHDWSLGFGVVFDHDEYGNTYTMNNQVTEYNEDITLGYLQGVKREREYEIGWGSGYRITWNTDNESLNDCHIQIALRGVQKKLSGPPLYNVVPYKQYKDNILYIDGNILINDLDIIKYYKENYYNSYFGGTAGVDTVMLRLVRYDSENSKYVYGGWVNVDPSIINSEGVQTSTVDRYGNISADNTSEDSYADKSSGFNLFSKETVTSSSANIIATLDNAQKFIGDGNFDVFLKSSFSFIPTEIWTIILSGLSVIVGFLFIKLILEVL